jgi:hypothetical protein
MKLGELDENSFLKILLNFFDKNQRITNHNDNKVIRKIVNDIGIPQYYDMLQHLDLDDNDVSLTVLSTLIKESTFHYFGDEKYHIKQMEILNKFNISKRNRFFLTAPTTFGKTFIVYEVIRRKKYNNICLIFPTIALMSENIMKIFKDESLLFIKDTYSIKTLSKASPVEEKNLYIFTPERYLAFRDEHDISFDFVFLDEAYKLDNSFEIDNVQSENERDIAYRICINNICQTCNDIFMAGPYIEFYKSDNPRSSSFTSFLSDNSIELLDYNDYELVIQDEILIKSARNFSIDGEVFEFLSSTKSGRFVELVSTLLSKKENSLVYCSRVADTERYGKLLLDEGVNCLLDKDDRYDSFVSHLTSTYGNNWILYRLLLSGIAIHHGLIPKYIQKEIIRLFNVGIVKILLCTTTITEGVNTTAKNMIVLSEKKGKKLLRKFDAKNISGRAGRFTKHFKGRVFILKNPFNNIKNSEVIEGLQHKNYDINTIKSETDLEITNEKYLTEQDKEKLEKIKNKAVELKIPERVMKRYSSVEYSTKFDIYCKVNELSNMQMKLIRKMISILVAFNGKRIDIFGLRIIIDILAPHFKDSSLKFLYERDVLHYTVSSYIKTGYKGMLKYNLVNLDRSIDVAIRNTSRVVFRSFKYDFVKLLGVFDEVYKHRLFIEGDYESIEDVVGVSILLNKLEYDALTEKGMLASDYGVSSKVVRMIDDNNTEDLDDFEVLLFGEFEDYYKSK